MEVVINTQVMFSQAMELNQNTRCSVNLHGYLVPQRWSFCRGGSVGRILFLTDWADLVVHLRLEMPKH